MLTKALIVSIPLAALVIGAFGCSDDDTTLAPTPTGLIATAVTTAPIVDGSMDAVWSSAAEYKVIVGADMNYQNGYGLLTVSMRAVTFNNMLYIYAEWADPSGSEDIRKKMWSNNGSTWVKGSGDEDRFFVMFNAGDNGTEGADCATMCHKPSADLMATTGGGHVDVWHWKAARTNPGGCADDKWWDGTGRGSDAKNSSLYTDNIESVGGVDRPMYMHSTGLAYTGNFLFEADKVVFDPNLNWTGKTIPFYVIDPSASGSRWDVAASGVYSAGKWTLELARAFNTGNSDDVVLGSGVIEVTIAITDNSGGTHSGSAPFDLRF